MRRLYIVAEGTGDTLFIYPGLEGFQLPALRMGLMQFGATQEMMHRNFHQMFKRVRWDSDTLCLSQNYDDMLFIMMGDDGALAEQSLRRELHMVHELLTFVYGENLRKQFRTPNQEARRRQELMLRRFMDAVFHLHDVEQAFLVQSIERLEMNRFLRNTCAETLQAASRGARHVSHVLLFVGTKLAASFMRPKTFDLTAADLFLITVYFYATFFMSDAVEEQQPQAGSAEPGSSATSSPPDTPRKAPGTPMSARSGQSGAFHTPRGADIPGGGAGAPGETPGSARKSGGGTPQRVPGVRRFEDFVAPLGVGSGAGAGASPSGDGGLDTSTGAASAGGEDDDSTYATLDAELEAVRARRRRLFVAEGEEPPAAESQPAVWERVHIASRRGAGPLHMYGATVGDGITLVVLSLCPPDAADEERTRMDQMRTSVTEGLSTCAAFLVAKARTQATMLSSRRLEDYPGIVHFIYVDRHAQRMMAPTIAPLHDPRPGEDPELAQRASTEALRRRVWDMARNVQARSAEGFTNVLVRSGGMAYTYRVWLEDSNGLELPLELPLLPPDVPADANFLRDHVRKHYPTRDVRLYELYAMFVATLADETIQAYCAAMTAQLRREQAEMDIA